LYISGRKSIISFFRFFAVFGKAAFILKPDPAVRYNLSRKKPFLQRRHKASAGRFFPAAKRSFFRERISTSIRGNLSSKSCNL